jgi:hypothetical protein
MPDWTPGPWEVFRFGPGLEVKTIYGCSGMDRSQFIPAVVMPGVNAEANARLIAAAPDLLAACELALPHLVNEPAADAVRAAIAQARGET